MICATEFFTTEIARSAWPLAASRIPAKFSTALPAIATTTIPANASETCSESIVGRSAATNQSETNAEPRPPTTSRVTATGSAIAGSCSSSSS